MVRTSVRKIVGRGVTVQHAIATYMGGVRVTAA